MNDEQEFVSRLVSIPIDEATPIMLSHHIYWNIGAFIDDDAITILNDTLQLPYADRYIQTDGILVPNGRIGVTKGTGLDFQKPTIIGDNIEKTNGSDFCGTGCVGIDNAFINDRSPYAGQYDPNFNVLHTYSPSSGIQLDVSTNMNGLQIYTCVGQNGTIPVKASQNHIEGQTTFVEKFGCIVIETQDVSIDGCIVMEAYADYIYSGSMVSTTRNGAVISIRSSRLRRSRLLTWPSSSSASRRRRSLHSSSRQR